MYQSAWGVPVEVLRASLGGHVGQVPLAELTEEQASVLQGVNALPLRVLIQTQVQGGLPVQVLEVLGGGLGLRLQTEGQSGIAGPSRRRRLVWQNKRGRVGR